jgi:hypothetical protein
VDQAVTAAVDNLVTSTDSIFATLDKTPGIPGN